MSGTTCNETMIGGSGNDSLTGSSHDDDIIRGGGRDLINTKGGDSAFREVGDDAIIGALSAGSGNEDRLDDGNRHVFDNATIASLEEDFAVWRGAGIYRARACAPVVDNGDTVLKDIRARFAAQMPLRREWA